MRRPEAELKDLRFDKVFAIHVGVFLRGKPVREEPIEDLASGRIVGVIATAG